MSGTPSTTFRSASGNRAGRWRPLFDSLERLLFVKSPAGVDRAMRGIARFILGADTRVVRTEFDAAFYLAQCDDPQERRVAEVDPLLHYSAIGRSRRRSPHRNFDPAFYREQRAGLSRLRDPFAHYLTVGRAAGLAPNGFDHGRPTRGPVRLRRVLVLDHARGGGSTRFLTHVESVLRERGSGIVRLRSVTGTQRLALWDDLDAGGGADAPPFFDLFADEDALVARARAAGVERFLVNHLVDRPLEVCDWIRRVAQRLECRFDVILHDFYYACPRVNGVDGSGRFCGLAPIAACRPCIDTFGSDIGPVDPALWRGSTLGLIAAANHVWVPSADAARRIDAFIGEPRCEVWPPESDDNRPPERAPLIAAERPMRVALLGRLSLAKGSRVLLGLAAEARRFQAPIIFEVIGTTDATPALIAAGVRVHGAYSRSTLPKLIADTQPDMALFPAIWPETWSYTLSEILDFGLPVVAFDIGAPAERLKKLGRGVIVPLALAERPRELLGLLMDLRQKWLRPG